MVRALYEDWQNALGNKAGRGRLACAACDRGGDVGVWRPFGRLSPILYGHDGAKALCCLLIIVPALRYVLELSATYPSAAVWDDLAPGFPQWALACRRFSSYVIVLGFFLPPGLVRSS